MGQNWTPIRGQSSTPIDNSPKNDAQTLKAYRPNQVASCDSGEFGQDIDQINARGPWRQRLLFAPATKSEECRRRGDRVGIAAFTRAKRGQHAAQRYSDQ